MARQQIRIYLKGGAVIEFVSDGFWVDHGSPRPSGSQIGTLQMGNVEDFDLKHIDLAEIAAITGEALKDPRRYGAT
jgi:hypothetical protein